MKPKKNTNKGKKYKKSGTLSLPKAKKLLPIDFHDLSLKPMELRFVAAYCSNGFVSSLSYKMAGYKAKSQSAQISGANKLLNKENVQEAIRRYIALILGPYKEKLEAQILEIYYNRAFYSIDMFYDPDGDLLPLDHIKKNHPEYLCVIDGIDKKFFGKDADVSVTSYQLASRDKALQTLNEYIKKADGTGIKELPSLKRQKLEEIFEEKKKGSVLDFPRKKA